MTRCGTKRIILPHAACWTCPYAVEWRHRSRPAPKARARYKARTYQRDLSPEDKAFIQSQYCPQKQSTKRDPARLSVRALAARYGVGCGVIAAIQRGGLSVCRSTIEPLPNP